MSQNSKIEWTNASWNPTTGCTKISEGCVNCYAERMAKRLQSMGHPNYSNGFELTIHPQMLNLPLTWKKPQLVFVNSMSDLFHENVPDSYIHEVIDIMKAANWHQFQVLTKRAERLEKFSKSIVWPENTWVGVTVENDKHCNRIEILRRIKSTTKFISFEPLIGQINYRNFSAIDWVIVGGESGPKSRPIEESWVKELRDACENQGVPFFFKQWGGVRKKEAGRVLEGRTWDGLPIKINNSVPILS